jgi:hypothetical protein
MLSKSCIDHAVAPLRNLSCLYIGTLFPASLFVAERKVPRHAKGRALLTKKLTRLAPECLIGCSTYVYDI